MITLHKLRLFAVVYERGSFNKAAAALYMAQSAVSQHMLDLERDLGAALFVRSARGVRPTEAGETLYRYATQILALVGEAEQAVLRAAGEEARQLHVSATPGISVYLLPMWLRRFQAAQPEISVSLQTALTAEIIAAVLAGEYDLGFLEGEGSSLQPELDQDALGKARLYDLHYHVVVNPAHAWANAGAITPEQLAAEPFIHRQSASRTRQWLDRTLAERGLKLRRVAELDSPGAVKYALLNAMGVSILPDYAVEREVERGELARVEVAGLTLVRPLMMVWDGRTPFTPLQRAFIRLLSADAPGLAMLG